MVEMLESTETLLPSPPSASAKKGGVRTQSVRSGALRVISIGFDEDSLDELDRLLTTLGVEPVGRVHAQVRRINPATYIGKGKIDEARAALESTGADAVIVDVELSPNQLRNLEKEFEQKPILDRPGVIIEIFSRHARTKESKTQVALARLQYLLPRLSHFWSHFERQRGGGATSRGMGEKQIEVDRRLVKKRIAVLTERLAAIERERKVQRAGRQDVLKVALVGYTNAGKSTLLNALTQSRVRAEDKLFATLDASIRSLDPNSHPPIVAIDTVGFISNLPHSLVASFRSTLEELEEADLLVHVVDASAAQAREQYEVTEKVLHELGVDGKPRLVVLNKRDLLGPGPSARNRAKLIVPGATAISALEPDEVRALRDQILDHFRKGMEVWEILVPYSESRLESQLHAHGSVEVSRHLEKGTFYRLRMEEGWARKLGLEKYRL
jgi:GTPase